MKYLITTAILLATAQGALAEPDGLVVQPGLYNGEITLQRSAMGPDGNMYSGPEQTGTTQVCLDLEDYLLTESDVALPNCQVERVALEGPSLFFRQSCMDGAGDMTSGQFAIRERMKVLNEREGVPMMRHNMLVTDEFTVSGNLSKEVNGAPDSLSIEAIYVRAGECPA